MQGNSPELIALVHWHHKERAPFMKRILCRLIGHEYNMFFVCRRCQPTKPIGDRHG